MTASARGRVEASGEQVRQKSALDRVILDKGWHRLERALRNAARKTGTQVVLVNPAHTSQTCHRCKVVDANSRKSRAEFACTCCGHTEHADVNAAKNILRAAGHAVPAWGCPVGEAGTSAPVRAGAPTGVADGWNPPASAVGRKSRTERVPRR